MTTEPQAQTSERETWRIPSRQVPAPEVIWVNTYPDGRAIGHTSEEKARACADLTDDPQIAVKYVRADADQIRDLRAKLAAREADAREKDLALIEARNTFRSYAHKHLDKGTVLGAEKALFNHAMAETMDAAIAAAHAPRSEDGGGKGEGEKVG